MSAVRLDRRSFLALSLASALTIGKGGAAVWAEQTPRIITVGAPVTEIAYALGAGPQVVGVDTTSRYPAQAQAVAQVGYMRTLAAEGLLSLAPTQILAQEGSGPAAVLQQMAGSGVEVTMIPEVPTVEGLLSKVEIIARALKRSDAGAALASRLQQQMAALQQDAQGAHGLQGQSVLCLIHAGQGGPMVAGSGTAADTLITLAGGQNVFASVQDYRPLSVEAAIAAAPQVLVISTSSLRQAGGLEAVLALPQVAQTPAAKVRRVAVVDGALLLGLGPRTPEAVQIIASA